MTVSNEQKFQKELEARFEDFLTSLRYSGYPLSPDKRTAAFGILVDEVARSGEDLSRLRHRLTPLLAIDRRSQEDIASRIEAFSAGLTLRYLNNTSSEVSLLASEKKRRNQLSIAFLTLLLLTAIGFFWYYAPNGQTLTSTIPDVTALSKSDPDPGDVAPNENTSENLLGGSVPHAMRPFVVLGGFLTPIVLAIFWTVLRWQRRRNWTIAAGRRLIEPDSRLANSYIARGIPLDGAVGDIADRLDGAINKNSHELDISATVEETVRVGNFFTPVQARERSVFGFVALIERRAPNDHLALLVDAIFDRIEEAGVTVRRLYYKNDPRRATTDGENYSVSPPVPIEERFGSDRLIVVGSSKGFFHPLTGELMDWAKALETLGSRTLLNAEPSRRWGYREGDLLNAGFSVGTASPEGIVQYACAVARAEDFVGGVPLNSVRPSSTLSTGDKYDQSTF